MKLNKKVLVSGILLLCMGTIMGVNTMCALESNDAQQKEVIEQLQEPTQEPIQEDSSITLLEFEEGMKEINIVELSEQGSNVRKFRVEARVEGDWQSIYTNDLIEGYHLGALEESITTNAIRLVIEEEASPVTITNISARYLESIQRDKPFTNTAYISSTYFEHDWDYINPDNFKSLTDIIMIGNFSFNTKGELVILDHGPAGDEAHAYAWDSEYAKEKLPIWKEKVTRHTDANVWVSITCFKGSPDGAPNGQTNVFNDPNVRKRFLEDLVYFAKVYDIAGYDIDWEYPGTASQWADYNNLILEASKLFKENGLMLSSAQATGSGLKLESLQSLDRINIMSYDNYGTTNNHSTFYNSAVRIIKEFKNKGIESHKLILGLPYYGVKVDSYFEQWDYKHVYKQMIEAQEFDLGTNIYNGWGFNGANLIRSKVVYALEQELGGVFCWQMKNDIEDFSEDASLAGTTSKTIKKFTVQ